MDLQQTLAELSDLPLGERLQLVQSLWDSFPVEAPIQLSPELRAELQRRLAEHDHDPSTALTRTEINALIQKNL